MPSAAASQVAPVAPLAARFSSEVPDAELVERVLDGDGWAKEALFRRHVVAVTRLATRLMDRRADADDVVQEAFAHALHDLPKLREPAAFRGWLLQLTVNRARAVFRRRKIVRFVGLDRGMPDAGFGDVAAPAASQEARLELVLLDRALRRLPVEQRLAWTLRKVEGHRLREVAEITGASLATVKRRVDAAQTAIDAHVRKGES